MKYDTVKEAAQAWVETFNSIPMSAIEKINEYDIEKTGCDSIVEITPPSVGDRVYVYNKTQGEIVARNIDDEENLYVVDLDSGETVTAKENEFDVLRYDPFPMWGTMFALTDPTDIEWANGEYLGPHLQEIADCGFRIYQSDDFGVLLGVDGAGYNFYEAHFIPLYKARGLHLHKEE